MNDRCDAPVWKKGGSITSAPVGYCALERGHAGDHMVKVETRAESERNATKQLDLDLSDAWKPNRDLPGGEVWIGPDGDPLPEYLIPDEL